jgi:hypothetical protein
MDMSGVIAHDDFAGVGGDIPPALGMRSAIEHRMLTAQFSCCRRLFRLTPMLHSPFIALLAIRGIAHVMAINK